MCRPSSAERSGVRHARAATGWLVGAVLVLAGPTGCGSEPSEPGGPAAPTGAEPTGPRSEAPPSPDIPPAGDLSCPGQVAFEAGILDYGAGSVGTTTDPVSAVQQWGQARGLEPGDALSARAAVGPAGSPPHEVLVRRGGLVVAVVSLTPSEDGTLLVTGYETCDDGGID